MVFDDLESLWNYAKEEIKNVMKNEVVEEIKNIEQEVIQEEVLDVYSPTYYDRRSETGDDDGLISKSNMIADYVDFDNSIMINITNDTRGNDTYPFSENTYIDEIIESGKGYTWKGSGIYKNPIARPFTENTQKRVDDGNVVLKTIRKYVGFETKQE